MPLILLLLAVPPRMSAEFTTAAALSHKVSGTAGDYVLGGEIVFTLPLHYDVLSLTLGVRAGSLGAKATDSSGTVTVQSSDVRMDLGVFPHWQFWFGHIARLRPGAVLFADLSLMTVTTRVDSATDKQVAVRGGLGYGLRVECDFGPWRYHPMVSVEGTAVNTFAPGESAIGFLGGGIGVAVP